MSNRKVLVTETNLENIASAIRTRAGTSDTMTPSQMPAAIRSIPSEGGGTVDLGEIVALNYEDLAFPVTEGSYCIYNDMLYRAMEDISEWESFDSTKWFHVRVGGELSGINTMLSDVYRDSNGVLFIGGNALKIDPNNSAAVPADTLLKVVRVEKGISYSSGASTITGDITDSNWTAAVNAGYTPIGVVGIQCSLGSYWFIYQFYLNGSSGVHVAVRRITGSTDGAGTATFDVDVLFLRTSL